MQRRPPRPRWQCRDADPLGEEGRGIGDALTADARDAEAVGDPAEAFLLPVGALAGTARRPAEGLHAPSSNTKVADWMVPRTHDSVQSPTAMPDITMPSRPGIWWPLAARGCRHRSAPEWHRVLHLAAHRDAAHQGAERGRLGQGRIGGDCRPVRPEDLAGVAFASTAGDRADRIQDRVCERVGSRVPLPACSNEPPGNDANVGSWSDVPAAGASSA